MTQTLFDKIWKTHVVREIPDGPVVFYIDRHFIHEVTSPQAFAGLEKRGIPVFRPEQVVATADHNVPTVDQHLPIKEELSRIQVETLVENCEKFGIELYGLGHDRQGIVHVIGPELGITQPGMTIVCGDSHTSTHGAFGNIAFGIGTSEVEMVLATQCLLQYKPKQMRIRIEGELAPGVVAKDIILFVLAQIGTHGATGHFIEYAGSTMESLSMEARMTICNMSIELGARGGLIAPDQITFEYLEGKPEAPKGKEWTDSLKHWKTLFTDKDAAFDKELVFDAAEIGPMITYGTNPGMGIPVDGQIPYSGSFKDSGAANSLKKSLSYMGFTEGDSLIGKPIDMVFIGSCTNSRIEDLRMAAKIVKGKQVAPNVEAIVVPGSSKIARQAENEGLVKVFLDAGFEFRQAGCSACLGMNEDKVPQGKYCVSTSNRNFEGRQGPGARTLLASPLTAAACALAGKIVHVGDPSFVNREALTQ